MLGHENIGLPIGQAKSTTRQRTFYVRHHKITIKSKMSTQCGALVGWIVFINNQKYKIHVLRRQEAEDKAFVKWVKKYAKPIED